jgi:hypothetical protein
MRDEFRQLPKENWSKPARGNISIDIWQEKLGDFGIGPKAGVEI